MASNVRSPHYYGEVIFRGDEHKFGTVVHINPFQPSDAMWRHTFHLSLICTSFVHWFQQWSQHAALTFYARLYMIKSPNIWTKVPVLKVFCRRGGRSAYKTRKNWAKDVHIKDRWKVRRLIASLGWKGLRNTLSKIGPLALERLFLLFNVQKLDPRLMKQFL
jgi:hypothetical protein